MFLLANVASWARQWTKKHSTSRNAIPQQSAASCTKSLQIGRNYARTKLYLRAQRFLPTRERWIRWHYVTSWSCPADPCGKKTCRTAKQHDRRVGFLSRFQAMEKDHGWRVLFLHLSICLNRVLLQIQMNLRNKTVRTHCPHYTANNMSSIMRLPFVNRWSVTKAVS